MPENIHNKKEKPIENKNITSYPTRTLDPPISIIDQAKEIENASNFIKTSVNNKLDVILKQIKNLQAEAKEIISNANKDMELHNITCNFQKIPGEIIHLYQNNLDKLYFSRLSPIDWKNNPPDKYVASYIFNHDKTFQKQN